MKQKQTEEPCPHEFTCCACRGTFHTDWSEEDAMAEFEKLYGSKGHKPTAARMCDDCWKAAGLDTGDPAKWKDVIQ